MTQLILEFPLEVDAVKTQGSELMVEMGNGVRLTSTIPPWVKAVRAAKFQLVMEIDGSPPDAAS